MTGEQEFISFINKKYKNLNGKDIDELVMLYWRKNDIYEAIFETEQAMEDEEFIDQHKQMRESLERFFKEEKDISKKIEEFYDSRRNGK